MNNKLHLDSNTTSFEKKETVRKNYDTIAEDYANEFGFYTEDLDVYDELAKYLDKDSKVLDLGAGTGLELIELFKKLPDTRVTAVDISENMLEKLKERDFKDKVTTICGNFFYVDFGDNYDAVISTSALHHFLMKDKIDLYKKIYDSLKEGGIFLNSDKIVLTNQEELDAIDFFNENINVKPHIDTPLSIEHEVEVLKESGFTEIEVSEVDKENYRLFKAYKR